MRSRVLVYFGSLLATIALINTPVPRIFVSAVLNPEAGDAVARSLGSVTKDLVLVLLLSIYFEWVRTKEQGELLRGIDGKLDALNTATAPALRQLVLDSTSPEELAATAFDRHMPHSGDKSSLVSLVLSPRPPHLDVSMVLRIEQVEGDVVHVCNLVETTMRRGLVLIAATTSPTHSAALSAVCPQLFEVTALPRLTPFSEAVKTYGEQLECYVVPPLGGTKRVEFRKVPANAVSRYITLPVGMASSELALFVADLSGESTELVRVRQYFYWSQDLSEHFIYWCADRPMFVRSITVDVRELLRAGRREVVVHAFLGGMESLMLDTDQGHLSTTLDRWLVQGQGVVAIW
ncbi:hypothetical protein [Lentzea cavernae]|uniref:Uncharacterized protein n=1 Tax=Lentzea cavernae TaxID=2020703 RepID=A0ABQ3MTD9_9PSEU|nr:hypothetical protein [Lentzea cavernae]GHH47526.1 hypothetical protein GCM10017774_51890 [Lentzea cavernae]